MDGPRPIRLPSAMPPPERAFLGPAIAGSGRHQSRRSRIQPPTKPPPPNPSSSAPPPPEVGADMESLSTAGGIVEDCAAGCEEMKKPASPPPLSWSRRRLLLVPVWVWGAAGLGRLFLLFLPKGHQCRASS